MKETGIDSMKYRKSTHLAGVDVEAIQDANGGKCILTIKECFYETQVDVNGKKLDGYFIVWKEEGFKPMSVNSTNRKTIGEIIRITKNCSAKESRNIGGWANQKLELYFEPTVKMKGETVGGIRIKPENPVREVDVPAAKAILKPSKTIEELKTNWSRLSLDQQAHAEVSKYKDELKTKLDAK